MFNRYITGGDGQTRNWRKVKRIIKKKVNRNHARALYKGKPWLRTHYHWFH
jgi:hypothetical protein